MKKHSTASYIIAIPDAFSLAMISSFEDLHDKILEKLGISNKEFDISQLSEALDFFKNESDIWISEMSTQHWIIFAIIQYYNLIIHEFKTEFKNARIFNILARGKQQRIEKILGGQYF